MLSDIQPPPDLLRFTRTAEHFGVLQEHTFAFHLLHKTAETPPGEWAPLGNERETPFAGHDPRRAQVSADLLRYLAGEIRNRLGTETDVLEYGEFSVIVTRDIDYRNLVSLGLDSGSNCLRDRFESFGATDRVIEDCYPHGATLLDAFELAVLRRYELTVQFELRQLDLLFLSW